MDYFMETGLKFKKIEKGLFILLQQTFGEVMKTVLEDLDRILA
jgi:hypothetical protein